MNTTSQQTIKGEWVIPAVTFLGICAMVNGKLLTPAMFLVWVALGWKVALLAARHLIVGKEGVKTAIGIAIYLAGIAFICALGVIL
jgi:hypothetical protein